MPSIIFHVPNEFREDIKSASHIRPGKMIQAFQNIGYEVDVVMGNAAARKEKIQRIKERIEGGHPYDFLYSESSTMPTLLTQRHHLPTHPLLDFGFFRYLKQKGIKIALFYRDIHWCFPIYRQNVGGLKYHLAVNMYRYDLKKYQELLDMLYLPNLGMLRHIPFSFTIPVKALPPGAEIQVNQSPTTQIPSILYVGGIRGIYDLRALVEAVGRVEKTELIICCREPEWTEVKGEYEALLNERIQVVHASGAELKELFQRANLGALMLKPSEYLEFAVPYKLFEYIGNAKPVLASSGTASAAFVEENGIGFVEEYKVDRIQSLLRNLERRPELIEKCAEQILEIQGDHTWEARARQVASDLT
ncbi:MAG: glycosyltransferase [Tissierellia bacterium]|nr:glycosyltransferase [Tissierellia bacterium]